MPFWPYLPIWPFLVGGAAICCFWNWRAGLSIAASIVSVITIQSFHFSHEQVLFLAVYSLIGAVTFFFMDKIAGVVLCAIAMVYVTHVIGVTEQLPKIILVELLLVLGIVGCGINGPSKGLFLGDNLSDRNRYIDHDRWRGIFVSTRKGADSEGDRI